ncbi:integrin alpha-X-like [Acipenser oxyrinchus oxyrinchus]|uniref:Integrin alpha-X-like n=1 Tax=Acipenser oxyrinchus oxyrinchus TaxID=40147 RepID=A0AAD8CKP0_ACIOX|nr:integrin alpha-X-like [Acipenser oxyrinchus oxyrinchus]
MDWCLFIFTYVIAVLIQSHGFNIETERSRVLNVSAEWFGHRVMQHSSGIIVSAPLDKSSNLFKCSYASGSCSPINIDGVTRTDDWGMGLSLAVSPTTNQLLACAPHLAHPCGKNMYLNSVCYKFDGKFLTPAPQNITPGYQGKVAQQPRVCAILVFWSDLGPTSIKNL